MNDYDDKHKPTNVTLIAPNKTDAETAQDYKERTITLYKPILDLCTEANQNGFEIMIQSGPGPLGKHIITTLKVIKVY